ncbi:MAG: hypothetical protein RL385_2356 [Pseudomonadota bacterium]|jgi:hypothetical protein
MQADAAFLFLSAHVTFPAAFAKFPLEGDNDILDTNTIAATLAVLGSGASLVACAHQAAPAAPKDAHHDDAAQGAVAACGAGSRGALPKSTRFSAGWRAA